MFVIQHENAQTTGKVKRGKRVAGQPARHDVIFRVQVAPVRNQIFKKLRKYGPREFVVRGYQHFRRLASQRDRYKSGFDKRYNINSRDYIHNDPG